MSYVDSEFEPPIDPDDLKMPESPEHRELTELIAVVAAHALGTEYVVYRDMNWYPLDQDSSAPKPVAPDVMVLPAGTLARSDRSYKQLADGPLPSVVVEVPSDSDSFFAMHEKADRYTKLGVPVYVAGGREGKNFVWLWDGENNEFTSWVGRPIPELGGLTLNIEPEDGYDRVVAYRPNGMRCLSSEHCVQVESDRADQMAAKADEMAAKAERLEAQLRALGTAPDV